MTVKEPSVLLLGHSLLVNKEGLPCGSISFILGCIGSGLDLDLRVCLPAPAPASSGFVFLKPTIFVAGICKWDPYTNECLLFVKSYLLLPEFGNGSH